MEIHWTNGRITYIPLNEPGNGVDVILGGNTSAEDTEDQYPSLYTVTLTTTTGEDNMADELYLGSNANRE
jgi:hypothetical protein